MNILKAIKNEVDKISKENKVILFGSRAREDSRGESDWDILILLDKVTHEEKNEIIIDQLYEIELATDQVISPIISTLDEWEKRSVTPIYQIVKEEGLEYGLLQSPINQL